MTRPQHQPYILHIKLFFWVTQVYAFSAENWRRPAPEVAFLLRLVDSVLQEEVQALADRGITLRFLGDLEALPTGLQKRVRWCATLGQSNGHIDICDLRTVICSSGSIDAHCRRGDS